MNADVLLAYYGQIADAPDAVGQLRRFVLDLAVRGKLVPQSAGDEPVPLGLHRVKANCSPKGAFGLPSTWLWVSVSAVAQTRLGKMLDKATNKGTPRPYLRNINVRWFGFDLSDLLKMPFEDSELAEFALRPGDVLICEGGEPGRAAVWRGEMEGVYFQKAIHRVRFTRLVDPDFFVFAIRANADDGRLAESFTGTGIKHFTGRGLEAYRFPLPPFAEQRRIVAKVNELMALCYQLEAARTARETTRDRMAAASLARLNTPNPGTFPSDARFALDALPALAARPDQIKQLRQTILNLAVRGKLVPQNPSDEPGAELLKRLHRQRAAIMVKANLRAKRPVSLPDDVNRDDLPRGWALEVLGNLVDPLATISYGVLVPGPDVDDGVPFIRVQDLALSNHPPRPQKIIAPDVEAPYARTRIRGGEILLCVVGSIGKLGIAPPSWTGANIARAVARISPMPEIGTEYALLVLRSERGQGYFADATRTLAQPTLNVGLIELLPMPIPPLAEQRRIVAKVNELMALCAALEASLTAATKMRSRLLEATLREVLRQAEMPLLEAAE